MGKKFYLCAIMAGFLGEYEVKIDAKGRLRIPTQLLRQLGDAASLPFVINRGFEKHLVLYPKTQWEKETDRLAELNQFVAENREFVRYFHRGANEVELDSSERVLIQKRLLEYAGIENDIVLFAYFDKIEIWAQAEYDKMLDVQPSDFAALAERVMKKDI